jgi:hypothetical protein
VPPDDLPRRGQHPLERERAAVRPPVSRDRRLRVDGRLVAGDDIALARVLGRGLDQRPQPGRERVQRPGLDRVDAALAEREHRDEAGAGEGLQVLGGLRLPEPGQLSQLADRPGPLGKKLDDAPPRVVAQC